MCGPNDRHENPFEEELPAVLIASYHAPRNSPFWKRFEFPVDLALRLGFVRYRGSLWTQCEGNSHGLVCFDISGAHDDYAGSIDLSCGIDPTDWSEDPDGEEMVWELLATWHVGQSL